MGRQRAHQRARVAVGTQRGVDLPDGAGRRVPGANPSRRRHQPGGHLQGIGDRDVVGGGFGDVDHVDVGQVVEFAGATLAHGEHRQPYLLVAGHLAARHRQRQAHHHVGEVGEVGGHLVHDGCRIRMVEVSGGDTQQFGLVRQPQPVRRLGVVQHQSTQPRPASTHPAQHGRLKLGATAAAGLGGEFGDQLRMCPQVQVEGEAAAEHPGQPLQPGRGREDLMHHLGAGFIQGGHALQSKVGVGCAGDLGEPPVGPGMPGVQGLDQLGGPYRVTEPLTGQQPRRGAGASTHLVSCGISADRGANRRRPIGQPSVAGRRGSMVACLPVDGRSR